VSTPGTDTHQVALGANGTDRCEHTGLAKPECHCAPCLRALIERYRPVPARRS
jgi:hypothetical protein